MRKKITLIRKAMRYSFITMLLIFTTTINAQSYNPFDSEDSIATADAMSEYKITLSKSTIPMHATINFQNLTSDTIFVPAWYEDVSRWGGGNGRSIMVNIMTYSDKDDIKYRIFLNDSMFEDNMFKLSDEKYVFIPPNTTLSLDLNLELHLKYVTMRSYTESTYYISIIINYRYGKLRKEWSYVARGVYETNQIEIIL